MKRLDEKQFEEMKKEILMNLKMMDATIKDITDTPEYKENCAYNKGVRDTLVILNKYRNNIIKKE